MVISMYVLTLLHSWAKIHVLYVTGVKEPATTWLHFFQTLKSKDKLEERSWEYVIACHFLELVSFPFHHLNHYLQRRVILTTVW